MKINNELKVGLLALSGIALLIWGYAYLKGKDVFSNNMIVYAIYDNVDGLTKSSTVSISGLKVGLVSDIQLMNDFSGRVLVKMELGQDVKVPRKATVPELVDLSLLGGKTIRLDYVGSCDGPSCIQHGDTLDGMNIGMIDDFTKEFDPYLERVQDVYGMLDSMFRDFATDNGGDDLGLTKTLKDFQGTLANLNSTTRNLNKLIVNSSSDVSGTMSNLNSISASFKNSEADIQRMIGNIGKFSDRLEGIELEETVDSTQMTFASVNSSLRNLDGAINDIQTLINEVQNGSGSLSLLIKDDAIYKRMDETLKSVELLTDDVRLNPKRYINIRKKSKDYEPMADPADEKGKQ